MLAVFAATLAACAVEPHVESVERHVNGDDPHVNGGEWAKATEMMREAPAVPMDVTASGDVILLQREAAAGYTLQVLQTKDRQILAEYVSDRRQIWPTLSPDGLLVALYLRKADGTAELLVWNTRTKAVTRPNVESTKIVLKPQWDSASRQFIHVRENDRMRDLYLVTVGDSKPGRLLRSDMTMRAGVAWSPDNRRVATVLAADSGSIAISGLDASASSVRVLEKGSVRDLAWSRDGERLLVTARPLTEEFYQLFAVNLNSGTVKRMTTAAGDVSLPAILGGRGFTYRVVRAGRTVSVACALDGSRCFDLDRDQSLESTVLGRSADGEVVYVKERRTIGPPALYAVTTQNGRISGDLWNPPQADLKAVKGEWLDVTASDGIKLPTYMWSTPHPPGERRAIVIYVWGARQQIPYWQPQYAYLLNAGIDYVIVIVRGRSGYGATLEKAPGGEAAQVGDVSAALHHVIDRFRMSHSDVLVVGHSFGATMVARAVAQDTGFSKVILGSMPPLKDSASSTQPGTVCAIQFHGALDPMSSEKGREATAGILGRGATSEPCGHFEILENEPHQYERATSWSKMFAAMVTTLGRRR